MGAAALASWVNIRKIRAARVAVEDAGEEFAGAWFANSVVVPVAVGGDEGLDVGPGVENVFTQSLH
jgi:hypothetical protein